MPERSPIVFLLDVDNTLIDNDRIAGDLKRYLTREVGAERLTTVLPRQGHYARAADVAAYPPADITIERIGELLRYDRSAFGRRHP